MIPGRCQRAAREATEASVGARKSTQVTSWDTFGDEKEADMGPEGVQKVSKKGSKLKLLKNS